MIALVVLFASTGSASAGRRRVVVLDFEGDKAEKFHDAVVKVIKKTHTVVATDKWNGEAESMSAEKVNDKNVKKVAKKLKVDGVVEGKVEKRRDEYIIRIKLRSGTTGEVVKPVNTKAENTKLDGDASDSIKDELVAAISELESNRDGSGDDDDEKVAKKKPAKADDDDDKPAKKTGFGRKKDDDDEKVAKKKPAKSDDDDKPAKKKPAKSDDDEKVAKKKPAKSDDDDKPAKKKPAKSDDDDEKVAKKKPAKSDDDRPAKKKPAKSDDDDEKVAKKDDDDNGGKKKKGKKVASAEDGEVSSGVEVGKKMDSDLALSPGERAIEVVVGASFNARRLSFNADADLGPTAMGSGRPPSYKGLPVTGAFLDLTVFPLAITHSNEGMLKNIGINVMSDKVLIIKSKDAAGKTLDTSMGRYAFGAAFRYPLGKGATAPLVGGKLRYGRQNFTIAGNADVPNVNYTIVDPSVFFKYPVSAKLALNAEVGYMVISNAGAIQRMDQYGDSSVNGLETEVGFDYVFAKQLFARASFRFETIGHQFKGAGAMTTGRDTDADVDVYSARDTYFGGVISVGLTY
ncbi:MAG: hypothetical protein KIT31_27515 [Deltaproteobacteria bacterium]|nr:hypothetical protein [Deltaproteobacteria bacterium]